MPFHRPDRTPTQLGFRMPAEWEPHDATWFAWPHREGSWPGRLHEIPPIYAEIVRALMPRERVRINVVDEAMRAFAESILRQHGAWSDAVELHIRPTDDSWARDHGPIYVVKDSPDGKRQRGIIDWGFNAWGGKYPPFDLDDTVPTRIAQAQDLPLWVPGIVMEGGSIDLNGRGTLLTTESCLLNPNRNPGHSREEIEQYLRDYLGVTNILWLGDGIEGDDTDGHVDDLTRFVSHSTVVTVVEDNPSDPNYRPLLENIERLQGMHDEAGNRLEVVLLPMPEPIEYDGQRLPASYANFLLANGSVLVPTFGCAADKEALGVMGELFPDREVIGIRCDTLVWGLGAIHCISQQEPAERP